MQKRGSRKVGGGEKLFSSFPPLVYLFSPPPPLPPPYLGAEKMRGGRKEKALLCFSCLLLLLHHFTIPPFPLSFPPIFRTLYARIPLLSPPSPYSFVQQATLGSWSYSTAILSLFFFFLLLSLVCPWGRFADSALRPPAHRSRPLCSLSLSPPRCVWLACQNDSGEGEREGRGRRLDWTLGQRRCRHVWSLPVTTHEKEGKERQKLMPLGLADNMQRRANIRGFFIFAQ